MQVSQPREAHAYAPMECEDHEQTNDCIIMPEGTWKEKWDLMILFLILYSAAIVPIRVCFNVDATGLLWVFEVSMSFCFLADVALTFRTAFFADGGWVKRPAEITARYLRTWFWIDAPSSLPLELLDLATNGSAGGLALLRFLRMLRLLRLLRLLKIDDYMDQLEDRLEVSINERIVDAVVMLIKVLFLAHVLGCFWYGISVLSRRCDRDDRGVIVCSPTWYEEYGSSRDDAHGSAVTEPTTAQLYLWGIYWSMMTLTTTGYGDIVPVNDTERLYMVGVMVISAVTYAYMISNVATLLSSLDRHADEVGAKIDAVKHYVRWRGLPRQLALRVKKHYKYFYKERAPFDETQLLNGCPLSLRAELTHYFLAETLGRMPLFQGVLDPEFQVELFPIIKPVSYAPGELIFHKGEPSRELIFLLQGEVDVWRRDGSTVDRRLTPTHEIFLGASADGDAPMAIEHTGCFGESVLTGVRREATHIAHTTVKAFVVSRDELEVLFTKNSRSARRIFACVLGESRRKTVVLTLALRMLLSILPKPSPLWAALYVQHRWAQYTRKFYCMPMPTLHTEEASSTKAREAAAAEAARLSSRRSSLGTSRRASLSSAVGQTEHFSSQLISTLKNELAEVVRTQVSVELAKLREELAKQALAPTPDPKPRSKFLRPPASSASAPPLEAISTIASVPGRPTDVTTNEAAPVCGDNRTRCFRDCCGAGGN